MLQDLSWENVLCGTFLDMLRVLKNVSDDEISNLNLNIIRYLIQGINNYKDQILNHLGYSETNSIIHLVNNILVKLSHEKREKEENLFGAGSKNKYRKLNPIDIIDGSK